MDCLILDDTAKLFQKFNNLLRIIQEKDQVNYKKISEINNRCDLTEEEWGVKQIISKFRSLLVNCESKYKVINEKVSRDVVKIFLFGKVSVGKSKLLNAMLGDEYFTSATAHTTSSFVHVRRSEDNNYKIKIKDNEESFEDKEEFIKKIERLSGNIKNNKATANQTIEVSICMEEEDTILKKNIEIVDCPGSGNKSEITDFIKRNSQDADIFIFVMNYALTDDDKVFFKYQADSSTKPDVFIVINSWDESDNDDKEATEMSEIKIKEECAKFLKDIGVKNEDEIAERIYFLSAKEMTQIRIKKDESLLLSKTNTQKRFQEFTRFEYNLKKYIDAPQGSKTRRYTQEIQNLQADLIKESKIFKQDILKEKKDFLKDKYEQMMKDTENFKLNIKSNGEKEKQQLVRKIKSQYSNISSNPNLTDVEWVKSQMENINSQLSISLKEVQTKQYKDFVHFLTTQDVTYNVNNLSKTDEPSTRSMWNLTIIKTTDEDPYKGYDALNGVVETLKFVGPLPLKITLAVTAAAFVTNLFTNAKKESDEKEKQENYKQQIKSKQKSAVVDIEEDVDKITEHYIENANKVIGMFKEKSDLFKGYWSTLEQLLKEISE